MVVPVKNNWVYVDNEWYHLNANGFMDTDWIYTDNNWFYLNPVSDGTRGKMLTGWQQIGPYKYYLNPVSDGTVVQERQAISSSMAHGICLT